MTASRILYLGIYITSIVEDGCFMPSFLKAQEKVAQRFDAILRRSLK
jgi:hypothetical protein